MSGGAGSYHTGLHCVARSRFLFLCLLSATFRSVVHRNHYLYVSYRHTQRMLLHSTVHPTTCFGSMSKKISSIKKGFNVCGQLNNAYLCKVILKWNRAMQECNSLEIRITYKACEPLVDIYKGFHVYKHLLFIKISYLLFCMS